jgi:hypothetical protein
LEFKKLKQLILGKSDKLTDYMLDQLGKQLPLLDYLHLFGYDKMKKPSLANYTKLQNLILDDCPSLTDEIL